MASLPSLFCGSAIRLVATGMLILLPFVILTSMIALLIISWWKHHWFTSDTGLKNPYKTVFKIINFARKHKHPLRRSAFTYCDDYIPFRLDFAKERYGGPFTTEQVENVKTFLRILHDFVVRNWICICSRSTRFVLFISSIWCPCPTTYSTCATECKGVLQCTIYSNWYWCPNVYYVDASIVPSLYLYHFHHPS